jgi:Fur family ferric uptake transcriptional regulator
MSTGRRSTKMDLVYDALVSEGGFVSAQDLYRKLKDRGENIGLATVYRSLQSLSESGSVVIARGDDSETIYSACEDGTHHHHLRCKRCGASVKIDSEEAERWTASVAREYGYVEVSHTFDIVGVCPKCQT